MILLQNQAEINAQDFNKLKSFLDEKVKLYNTLDFIVDDPISIPHRFSKLQDIEIMGFWTAMLSWGQRKTILIKANNLIELMDKAPHAFIIGHTQNDLKRFAQFKHRTFNYTDTLYFIYALKKLYNGYDSMEKAFLCEGYTMEKTVEKMLIQFHNIFFDDEHAPRRTHKHVSSPSTKSTCKRLNMFLRWMVRDNSTGVDFGCWKNIKSSQLICPLDVHVDRIARRFNLLNRKQMDWQAAIELTENLRHFDEKDPVKYDFALFGTGVMEKGGMIF